MTPSDRNACCTALSHICSEVMSEGAWSRAFNASDWRDRFSEPTVVGVDFPTVAVVEARNDLETGTLHVSIQSPTNAMSGDATSFKIVQLDGVNLAAVTATCNGSTFRDFTVSDGSINVHTTVGKHSFIFATGFHGAETSKL